MTEKELYEEVQKLVPKINELATSVSVIEKRTVSIELGLLGNEFNDNSGLVKSFDSLKNEFHDFKKETNEQLEELKTYKTGMTWSVKILIGLFITTVAAEISGAFKWIINHFKQ